MAHTLTGMASGSNPSRSAFPPAVWVAYHAGVESQVAIPRESSSFTDGIRRTIGRVLPRRFVRLLQVRRRVTDGSKRMPVIRPRLSLRGSMALVALAALLLIGVVLWQRSAEYR